MQLTLTLAFSLKMLKEVQYGKSKIKNQETKSRNYTAFKSNGSCKNQKTKINKGE